MLLAIEFVAGVAAGVGVILNNVEKSNNNKKDTDSDDLDVSELKYPEE